MTFRSRLVVPSLLLTLVAVTLFGQSSVLNPTVKVLPRAVTPVPPECEEGVAPQQAQRITAEDRAAVPDARMGMEAPPRDDLRSALSAASTAAQRSDRDALREATSRARSVVATYPRGGEVDAATNLLNLFADVDRLLEWQFTSPTGGFFQPDSDLGMMMSRYPAFDAYIRDLILTDARGNRFIPTSESRAFLLTEASLRLSRLGIGAQPAVRPVAERPLRQQTTTPPSVVSEKAPSGKPLPKTTASRPAPESKSARVETVRTSVPHTTASASASRRSRPASASKARSESSTTSSRSRPSTKRGTEPKPAGAAPSPPAASPVDELLAESGSPPPAATTTSAPATPFTPATVPMTTTPAVADSTTSQSPAAPGSTVTTGAPATTIAPVTTSAETATAGTATQDATSDAVPAQRPRRNLMLPLMLILIGVGVLVLLFRAST